MRKIAFCIADNKNLPYFEMMKNSLRKFHSEEDLPLQLIDETQIKAFKDPDFFYRATPIIASTLIDNYDCVIKLDADQIITGDLSAIWESDFDVAVVNNSNPREMKAYPVTVWNIHPLSYVNCGLVVMKSKLFIDHWNWMCHQSFFYEYQMREQDLLNIMIRYNPFNVKRLDEGGSYYGLASKGYWPDIELIGKDLVLKKNAEWPRESDKIIRCIHFAGGNSPDKMNLKLWFTPQVQKYLEGLTK